MPNASLPEVAVPVSVKLVLCAFCSIPFGLPEIMHRRRLIDGKVFYCPAGHENLFGGETLETLRARVAELEGLLQRAETRASDLEAELKAHEPVLPLELAPTEEPVDGTREATRGLRRAKTPSPEPRESPHRRAQRDRIFKFVKQHGGKVTPEHVAEGLGMFRTTAERGLNDLASEQKLLRGFDGTFSSKP